MKLTITTKWFLWMSFGVAVFCMGQVLGMAWLEIRELAHGEGTLSEDVAEISVLLSVSLSIFVLMLGGIWFISKRMVRPIRTIAESAKRISDGDLAERVEGEGSTDEIGMLVSALNHAFDRYDDVVRRRDRFAGNAAHQLRTPLASIRSLGEVCLQKERNGEEYRECIGDMLEVTREMANVVEKLLMIARMNRSRVQPGFVGVDVTGIVGDTLDDYGALIQEKNIQLDRHMQPSLPVQGEETLIRQAVTNVIDNAVKYTPEGGDITVTLRPGNGGTELAVSDNGPGIPAHVLDIVAQATDNIAFTREFPTGRLGLAIVSEIMTIHDGLLKFTPGERGGTCVRLVFPAPGRSVDQSSRMTR